MFEQAWSDASFDIPRLLAWKEAGDFTRLWEPLHAFVDFGVYHLDVVGRLTPPMNGNSEFTAPRSLVSQAGRSHWDLCSS
jgi:hypothetical protein